MYAIIETGGKQYKVEEGDILDIDLISKKKNEKVEFKEVLLLRDENLTKVGLPYVENCHVEAEVVEEEVKGKKVISFKYKRRKQYRRTRGHRQQHSAVRIEKIKVAG